MSYVSRSRVRSAFPIRRETGWSSLLEALGKKSTVQFRDKQQGRRSLSGLASCLGLYSMCATSHRSEPKRHRESPHWKSIDFPLRIPTQASAPLEKEWPGMNPGPFAFLPIESGPLRTSHHREWHQARLRKTCRNRTENVV